MTVKLIWVTPEAEKNILYAARVSSKNQDSEDTRLIDYCIRNGHFSVFEMANMCLEITTSRTIARQILRHRSFTFQEFSGRYQTFSTIGGDSSMITAPRLQDNKNRQNSIDVEDEDLEQWWTDAQITVIHECERLYNKALKKGIAKELARNLLPEGLTPSKMYMNGTLRSWLHYIDLRCGNGTQREHQEVAEAVKREFIKQFPIISRAKGYIE